jgi:hypothetical protein
MAIADSPQLLHSVQKLPSHYSTLYEMTKIPPEQLEELIADGTFTVSTTRAEVVKCLPKPKRKKATKPRQARVKTPTEEITGVPEPAPVKPMPAWERYHLYTKDIWSELVKTLEDDPDADRQHNEDMAAIRAEAGLAGQTEDRPLAASPSVVPSDQAVFTKTADLRSDKPLTTPLEDAIAHQEQGGSEPIPPPENAPSVVPEDGRPSGRPLDGWPEMPEDLDRAKQIRAALLQQRAVSAPHPREA